MAEPQTTSLKRPIFQDIFGEDWGALPPVFKARYANRPFSSDRTRVEGMLDIQCRSFMTWLRPFYRLLGSVPAVSERNVPVTVNFDSHPNTREFHFNRTFNFSQRRTYCFHSRMRQEQGSRLIEIMRFGICWRLSCHWQAGKVRLIHRGYALKLFGVLLPLPISLLVGRGDAEEIAVDDEQFDMRVTITHPILGVIYAYSGRFKLIK